MLSSFNKRTPFLVLGYFTAWIVYFASFWSRALFMDSHGNFVAGHVNIWGDWAVHFTMANAMAERSIIGLSSPLLINTPFSYPFVADFISALCLQLGMPYIASFVVPSFLASIFLVGALYWFYKTMFRSSAVAITGSLIFLLNGGVGFYYFLRDLLASPHPWNTFLNPPHEYTRIDAEAIRWISVIDSMMIPQRAFPLGFGIAVLALGLVWKKIITSSPLEALSSKNLTVLAGIGVLLGTLPIVHTHSFLAMFIILACWSITDLIMVSAAERKAHFLQWFTVASVTSAIALPLIYIYFFQNTQEHFFRFYPGWLATENKVPWLLFWWKNWGITPFVAVVGFLLAGAEKTLRQRKLFLPPAIWFLPFFMLFVLINLFLFQPWAWDNTKILAWSSLGVSGLAAAGIVTLWRLQFSHKFITFIKNFLLTGVFVCLIASGSIDAYRVLRIDLHSYVMYSADELSLAEWVKTETPTDSIWLTGNHHNHWLFNLTGRQAIMTYPGWLWTHGYNWQPIENEVKNMYQMTPAGVAAVRKYNVKYIVVGDSERRTLSPNEKFFRQNFTLVKEQGTTQIYRLP